MEGSGEHSETAWEIRLAGASGLSICCLEGKCDLATPLGLGLGLELNYT